MSVTVGTGTTEQGRDWKITQGTKPSNGGYHDHVWQEFAGIAIELGGYSDITAIDPYSGRRFWLSDAFRCDQHTAQLKAATPGDEAIAVYQAAHECADCSGTFFNAIRRLLDAMEAVGFPEDGYKPNADEFRQNA
jgi:hypothetical protein